MEGCVSFLPFSSTLRQLGSIACAAVFLAACSSGGGDGGGGTSPAASSSSGTFVDSPVQGLGYQALPSGLVGKTDATGHYQYMPGDMVSFDLGGRVIGTALGGPQVTALSIFSAASVTDLSVVNLSQLLLTLGGSPNSDNVIVLPSPLPANLPQTLPNFSDPTFATQLKTAGFPLTVSDTEASTHLQTSFKTLSVTVDHSGAVTSNPAGINCTVAGTCSFAFVADTKVTLTAIGNGFIGWSGAGCSGTGTCVVTMNADTAVTAPFPGAPPPATLTILPNQGTGTGVVTCSADGGASFVACATSASYVSGMALILQATANSGSTFGGWVDGTGNATICNGSTDNCSMTLTADSAVRGSFVLNTVAFSLMANTSSSNGGGGSIACSTTGGASFGDCASSYNAGTDLTLQARADNASNFSGWGSGSGSGSGSLSACNTTMGLCNFVMTGNSSITANFNRPRLTVVVNGTGTVTSTNVADINCGPTCSAAFDKGTVTLTATADLGSTFTGWSGGGCSGPSLTCLVPLTVDTTVTALFSTAPPPGTRPSFITEVHSATDVGTLGVPSSTATLSLTVSGTNTLLLAGWHSEWDNSPLPPFTPLPEGWTVTNNGIPGTEIVDTDGYTGGAGNRRFRIYYWLNPPPGPNTVIVTNPGANDTPNELAVSVVLLSNVAQTSPLGAIAKDVSTSARTGESETVSTTTNDLVVHVIADALVTRGTLGTGETSISVANDGHHPADGDASLWISIKPGEPGSTTVSSSGWASRVINGAAIVVHGQ